MGCVRPHTVFSHTFLSAPAPLVSTTTAGSSWLLLGFRLGDGGGAKGVDGLKSHCPRNVHFWAVCVHMLLSCPPFQVYLRQQHQSRRLGAHGHCWGFSGVQGKAMGWVNGVI